MDQVQYGTTLSDDEQHLYSQFRRKINTEAARAQIKKLEYNLAEVTAGVGVLKGACADGNSLGLGGICVMPNFVKTCSGLLGLKRNCLLIACIGYPHGGDTTAVKVKAVKLALRDGADEVEVTAPVAYIRDGNFAYVKREFKKLRKACKKHALRIDAECALLSEQEILKVCRIAADCGVNSIKAGSSAYSNGSEIKMMTDIKTAVKDKCAIKADGVATVIEMSSAIDTGASVIGSKNAAEVARAILTLAEAKS